MELSPLPLVAAVHQECPQHRAKQADDGGCKKGAEGMRDLGLSWWLGDAYTAMGVQREVLPVLRAHPGWLPSVKGEQNKGERLVSAVLGTGCWCDRSYAEINSWNEGVEWNTLLSGSLATSVLVNYTCRCTEQPWLPAPLHGVPCAPHWTAPRPGQVHASCHWQLCQAHVNS